MATAGSTPLNDEYNPPTALSLPSTPDCSGSCFQYLEFGEPVFYTFLTNLELQHGFLEVFKRASAYEHILIFLKSLCHSFNR